MVGYHCQDMALARLGIEHLRAAGTVLKVLLKNPDAQRVGRRSVSLPLQPLPL
jgi:hypothetical protein